MVLLTLERSEDYIELSQNVMYLLTIFGDTKLITNKKIESEIEFELEYIDYLDSHKINYEDIDMIIYLENDELKYSKLIKNEKFNKKYK